MYSGGKPLLIQQYARICLSSEGLEKDTSRISLCNNFQRRFPEFVFDPAIFLVNPLVWERVARTLPELLQQFSGASTGSSGEMLTTFCKQNDGGFIRRRNV